MTDDDNNWPQVPELSEEEIKAQKRRNLWLGLALGGLVILVGMITSMRLLENLGRTAGG